MRRTFLFAGLLVFTSALRSQVRYDVLLKGGHVIDPKNRIDQVMDVAIAERKIARVAANIPAAEAKQVINVTGLFVTPGLVDMHIHAYASTGQKGEYNGDRSLYPDGYTLRNGVTTAVDAGTSGWTSFPDFKEKVIDRARTRVLAMINILGQGMGNREKVEQNTADMDPQAAAKMARKYPEIIVGIKTAHYMGPEWTAVDRTVEAAKLAGVPAMIDFGNFNPGRPYEELVTKHLRPGDISTHMYTQFVPMIDDQGKVRSYLFEARKRGVKFDLGHGGGSFSWKNAVPGIQQGFLPDAISTDLHTGSMNAGMKSMNNLMSKVLSLGVPLAKVIELTTISPALVIKRPEFGHLSVGAGADVAVFRVDEGQFGFLDARRARFMGTKMLVCELTLRDGAIEWDLNGRAGVDWKDYYKVKKEANFLGRETSP
jgi:dihydroorotase